jgi:nicotinate-nucleotide adenylyltransferase
VPQDAALSRQLRLPPHAPGMRIGLLGGSFNPPHRAHRDISLFALKRLKLDGVWWLVTPGNPLKDTRALPPLDTRLAAAKAIAAHPRIAVSGIEAAIGTSYSYATIDWLMARCPGVHFVWIMGADNLVTFHRWRNWRRIAQALPIAVIDRGGVRLSATSAPAAGALARYRLPQSAASRLAEQQPPAWVFLHGLKSSVSSTAIRQQSSAESG